MHTIEELIGLIEGSAHDELRKIDDLAQKDEELADRLALATARAAMQEVRTMKAVDAERAAKFFEAVARRGAGEGAMALVRTLQQPSPPERSSSLFELVQQSTSVENTAELAAAVHVPISLFSRWSRVHVCAPAEFTELLEQELAAALSLATESVRSALAQLEEAPKAAAKASHRRPKRTRPREQKPLSQDPLDISNFIEVCEFDEADGRWWSERLGQGIEA